VYNGISDTLRADTRNGSSFHFDKGDMLDAVSRRAVADGEIPSYEEQIESRTQEY